MVSDGAVRVVGSEFYLGITSAFGYDHMRCIFFFLFAGMYHSLVDQYVCMLNLAKLEAHICAWGSST